jgi:pilus assembly protein Flp/PilA
MVPHAIAWVQDLFDTEEEGQGLVEYALIIVLVSIVSMVALRALGVQIGAIFTRISGVLAAG